MRHAPFARYQHHTEARSPSAFAVEQKFGRKYRGVWTCLTAGYVAVMLGLSGPAQAQYKIVGPDGRITFSDRPVAPPDAKVAPIKTRRAGPSMANLPYDLAQVASRYPVTLYTLTKDCAACDQARDFLKTRGIPFAERTAATQDDIDELRKQTNATEIPSVKIGTQVLRGFSQGDWSSFLDVAGYPSESRLPPNYSQASPSPLTEPKVAATKKEETRKAPPPPSLEPSTGTAGIRF